MEYDCDCSCNCPIQDGCGETSDNSEMTLLGYGGYDWWSDFGDPNPGRMRFLEKQPTKPFSDYKDRPFPFDIFYSYFPEFENSPDYPATFIASAAKEARMFVRNSWCRELDGPDRLYALNLIVAHFSVLNKTRQTTLKGSATPGTGVFSGGDNGPGIVTSASVGGVNVSKGMMLQPKSYWEEFFYSTPYGRSFLAFMHQQTAGGLYYEGGDNFRAFLRP